MHNIQLIIVKLVFALRRIFLWCALFESRAEGIKGKQKIGMKNQLSYLTTILEENSNFDDVFKEGHHESCVT
jgi:hypothetical protein